MTDTKQMLMASMSAVMLVVDNLLLCGQSLKAEALRPR
jgi:hypothetical protein